MRSLIIAIMLSTIATFTASAQNVEGKLTCSQGQQGCLKTGGAKDACQQRYRSCVQTGCWMGFQVQKCGYVKK